MQQRERVPPSDLNEDFLGDVLYRWVIFSHDARWTRAQKYQLLQAAPNPQTFIDKYSATSVSASRATDEGLSLAQIAAVNETQAFLRKPNHHCVVIGDSAYPQILAQIVDPPLVLYAIGNLALLAEPCVSMVGSRRPTELGTRATQVLAAELSEAGITIVSGLALGVDGASHAAALRAGGNTIAVLGCGVDVVYPARHRALYERICANGLVLSEYLPRSPALPYRFPERNRIVSGLSLGTLIVEAAEHSGTLITARFSIEQNRELFVVPGSYFSQQYVGSHTLIQQGAHLVTSSADVLIELATALRAYLGQPPASIQSQLHIESSAILESSSANSGRAVVDNDCQEVLELLAREAMTTDALVLKTGLMAREVSAVLLALELDNLISRTADGRYYSCVSR